MMKSWSVEAMLMIGGKRVHFNDVISILIRRNQGQIQDF